MLTFEPFKILDSEFIKNTTIFDEYNYSSYNYNFIILIQLFLMNAESDSLKGLSNSSTLYFSRGNSHWELLSDVKILQHFI